MIACTKETEKEVFSKPSTTRKIGIRLDIENDDIRYLKKIYRTSNNTTAIRQSLLDIIQLMTMFGNKHPEVIFDKLRTQQEQITQAKVA
jgi:hypothetical protein